MVYLRQIRSDFRTWLIYNLPTNFHSYGIIRLSESFRILENAWVDSKGSFSEKLLVIHLVSSSLYKVK